MARDAPQRPFPEVNSIRVVAHQERRNLPLYAFLVIEGVVQWKVLPLVVMPSGTSTLVGQGWYPTQQPPVVNVYLPTPQPTMTSTPYPTAAPTSTVRPTLLDQYGRCNVQTARGGDLCVVVPTPEPQPTIRPCDWVTPGLCVVAGETRDTKGGQDVGN